MGWEGYIRLLGGVEREEMGRLHQEIGSDGKGRGWVGWIRRFGGLGRKERGWTGYIRRLNRAAREEDRKATSRDWER